MKVVIALCLACLFATALSQATRGAAAGGNAQQMAMLAALARRGGGRGGAAINPMMSMFLIRSGMEPMEAMMCMRMPIMCMAYM